VFERGEAWAPDEIGPYNATARMREIIRIKDRIDESEKGMPKGPKDWGLGHFA
jgi:hypothetical protein